MDQNVLGNEELLFFSVSDVTPNLLWFGIGREDFYQFFILNLKYWTNCIFEKLKDQNLKKIYFTNFLVNKSLLFIRYSMYVIRSNWLTFSITWSASHYLFYLISAPRKQSISLLHPVYFCMYISVLCSVCLPFSFVYQITFFRLIHPIGIPFFLPKIDDCSTIHSVRWWER